MLRKIALGFALAVAVAPTADAFTSPSSMMVSSKARLNAAASARMRPAVRKSGVKMSAEAFEGAQAVLSAVQNVPFVDELTGEPQGFTAPLNHFASVLSLWVSLVGTNHYISDN